MDYALAENKNPGLAWDQARTRRRQKPRTSPEPQSRARKSGAERLAAFVKRLADAVAKTALFLALVYGAYHGYRFLTASPRFAVEDVKIRGNHVLTAEQVLGWTGNPKGENIFLLELKGMAGRLGEHPWVRSVSVERVFPRRINIAIEERTPYARVRMDRTYVIDNYGVVLTLDGSEYDRLPLIVGLGKPSARLGENVVTDRIIRGLHTMHYFNRLKFFQGDPIDTFQMIGAHRVAFKTRNKGRKIFMDLNAPAESFQNFKIYLNALPEGEMDFQYIDLSFKGKVIVKSERRAEEGPGAEKL
ncbi:MAG: FtsQ-type POTRA domain-containing protein [Nitrospinae bacterium]|nr:FtsQ-type POTRA domain-containing protein [Nitrospinota bacterium]